MRCWRNWLSHVRALCTPHTRVRIYYTELTSYETLFVVDIVVLSNGKVYAIHGHNQFPIWEVDPTDGLSTKLNIERPSDLVHFRGVSTIPYRQSETQFLALGKDSSVWKLFIVDVVAETMVPTLKDFATLNFPFFLYNFFFARI